MDRPELPRDALFTVLLNVDYIDLDKTCNSSKKFKRICNDERFWLLKSAHDANKDLTEEFEQWWWEGKFSNKERYLRTMCYRGVYYPGSTLFVSEYELVVYAIEHNDVAWLNKMMLLLIRDPRTKEEEHGLPNSYLVSLLLKRGYYAQATNFITSGAFMIFDVEIEYLIAAEEYKLIERIENYSQTLQHPIIAEKSYILGQLILGEDVNLRELDDEEAAAFYSVLYKRSIKVTDFIWPYVLFAKMILSDEIAVRDLLRIKPANFHIDFSHYAVRAFTETNLDTVPIMKALLPHLQTSVIFTVISETYYKKPLFKWFLNEYLTRPIRQFDEMVDLFNLKQFLDFNGLRMLFPKISKEVKEEFITVMQEGDPSRRVFPYCPEMNHVLETS